MSMDYREQSRAAQDAVRRTLGGKVYQVNTLSAVSDLITKEELKQSILLLGNKVEREYGGRKYIDFVLESEKDQLKVDSLFHFICTVKEDDPRGMITQAAIQKVLGGSDPFEQLDGDPRALRKIQTQERKWSLDWIGLVPRNADGLVQVLETLGAFSLTDQRERNELRKLGFHREHNGGAYFPYMLKEEFKEETDEARSSRESLEHLYGASELPREWTEEYTNFIDRACWMFIHYGVPGVREMIATQYLVYKKQFTSFDCKKFINEWEETMNKGKIKEEDKLTTYEMYTNWLPQPHCAIVALQENFGHQKNSQAEALLRALLEKLIHSKTFISKEKIPFDKISKWFKEAEIPFVIEQKIYNVSQKRWKSDKLPKREWKKNMEQENCVYIKLGQWNGEHYFYWREDVNREYRISEWPDVYKEKIMVEKTPSVHEYQVDPYRPPIKVLPSYSSGRLLATLVEKRFVVPIAGLFEEYSGIYEEEKLNLCDELEFFHSNPEVLKECCVPDIEEKLNKKLGVKCIPRDCLFAGDTESFIDPVTGIHNPSLIVIKGIYRKDLDISVGLWESDNPIRDAMKIFLKKYTNWVFSELKRISDLDHPAAKTLKNRLEKNKDIKTLKQVYRKILKGIPKYTEIFDKKLLSPRIYFHNLGYDVQAFITQFSPAKKEAAIKKGAVWYSMTFKFMGAEFILRNSFTIITTALKNFPKMFLPKEEQEKMKKEVYAYDAINENLMMVRETSFGKRFVVSLQNMEAAIQLYEYHKNAEEKAKLLEDLWKSASEVGCLEGKYGEFFDVGKYSKYYCERDVDLLAIGMKSWEAIGEQDATKNTFKGMPPFKKFDVYNFMSAPAIAQAVTEAAVRQGSPIKLNEKEKPNDVTYKYKGRLREFMLKCTTGGRCTLANEKRQLVDCRKEDPKVAELIEKSKDPDRGLSTEDEKYLYQHLIQDFDARSLYPTAMSRASIPLGIPEVVYFGPKSQKTERWIFLSAANGQAPDDAMYVITDITYDKKLAMPTNCWKQEKPEPRCRWNNEVPAGLMQLRKLTDLRTMMNIQGAHFRVLGGLEWRHGKCDKIQQFMKDVYAFRRLNHSGGFDHPIQEAAKLIMNSFYGKNVTKIRETEEMFFPARVWNYDEKTKKFTEHDGVKELLEFIKKNWRKITQIQYMGGCFILKLKSKDDAAYDVNFGCEVLAGSRAVICPVSAMVEQITGKPCLYTDTDSLHLYGWQVDAIAGAFKAYFGMDMIGGELGQFHVDFEPRTFRKGEKCLGSARFCGVGKKMYIDELIGSEGSCEYHRRAKGIRADSLSWEEYLQLYYGATLYKDLDKCGMVQIRQKAGHNMSVHMVKQVRATAEGEVEVITDLVESKDGERLIEDLDLDGLLSAAGELEQEAERVVTDDEDLEKQQAEKRKREEEQKNAIEGNEDDTIEIIYDPESDIDLAEHDEPIEIIETPAPKKVADEVQKNVQRWLRDFDARDKAMMYETLERFLAGGEMGEDDWFYLGRLNANNDDQVYARESIRQLQQDLSQFQDELNKLK